MQKRTEESAVKTIHSCAVQYEQNLANKSVLFLSTKDNTAGFLEVTFLPQNFLHLTGVKSNLNGERFFNAALLNRLNTDDILLAPDGVSDLKLDVLPQLMNIHLSARMVGDYDGKGSSSLLVTDKLAGTVTAAMGFVPGEGMNGMYVPNTALKKDVRDIIALGTQRRIVAIFTKGRRDKLYKTLTYTAKGVSLSDDIFADVLREKVEGDVSVGDGLARPVK
jgi:hypothetical protein